MKVLYFLEPREELGNPIFRLGTVRNHISKEMDALNSLGNKCDARLLTSEAVKKASLKEGLLTSDVFFSISQSVLKKHFPNEQLISSQFFNNQYSQKDSKIMQRLCSKAIGAWVPDVVVCYEGAAPYLREMYPNAAFLNSTLGMLSRAPYPELGCFDPCGIFKNSYIKKFEKELKELKATSHQIELLDRFRKTYKEYINQNNPISRSDIPGTFDRIILVPLQVSGYFAFDDNLPKETKYENQLDFVRYVLEQVPSTIGVYVTLHGAEDKLFDDVTLTQLRKKFPNFLFCSELQKIRWSSQWLLPFVDGVATVSSSVGLQALIWKKPVFIHGDSHISPFNAGNLSEVERILDREYNFDGALFHLLTRYYPLMQEQVQNADWLYSFLKKSIDKQCAGEIQFDYFDPPKNESVAIQKLIDNLNNMQTMNDLERFASHIPSRKIVDLAAAKKRILKHDVISFDIFDTLITRRLMHPNHVFDLMHYEAKKIFKDNGQDIGSYGGYRNLRERAANRVIRRTKAQGGEEILFKDIYNEIKALTGLTHDAILKIRTLELKTEKDIITVRALGQELYEFALAHGKPIILVSDMYLDKSDIEFILQKNGFQNYSKLYVSSDYNKLKKTGTLFNEVKSDFKNKKIIHFGDNYLSDVLRAAESGFTSVHLPLINETYMASRLAKDTLNPAEVSDSVSSSIMHGVISRKFYDNKLFENSWFDNSPYRMGFEACGTILLGFTKWVMDSAIRDGVEELYFLARDGYLVKKIYDQISKHVPSAPKSHYLLASRRCYNTASLKTEQDILNSTSLSFSQVPLYKIMEARFGINRNEIDLRTVRAAGLASLDQLVDIKRRSQLNKFKRFLTENKELILQKALGERECLLEYLDHMGLNSGKKIAIVDIGHNASLQRSLGSLLGNRNDIGGYYFMTYHAAKEVFDEGFNVQGYLSNFEDNKISNHPYCKNIGMFEFLFLPSIPSFKRFVRNSTQGKLVEEYVDGDESARFRVIDIVHKGVTDYVDSVLRVLNGNLSAYNVSKNRALNTYVNFIQNPLPSDAKMFDGLSFVDQFGGSDARYLIATPVYKSITQENYNDYVRDSWWREGARSLANEALPISGRIYKATNAAAIFRKDKKGKTIFQRKLNKLINNPVKFFYDARFIRILRNQAVE